MKQEKKTDDTTPTYQLVETIPARKGHSTTEEIVTINSKA